MSWRNPTKRVLSVTAITVGLFGLAVLATADEKKATEGKSRVFKTRVVNAPSATGFPAGAVAEALRAAPGTAKELGRLNEEEKRALMTRLERAFRLNRSSEGLQAVQSASGVLSMDLQGRYLHIQVARQNADGSVSTACVTDWASAQAFLQGAPAPLRAQGRVEP